ncbi:MAG TPA: methylenetetrahydrofolate reductase [NAD(P)H], partial [Mobilitalea sp.]|nr:methylenetetrahydrofolate reductase [NAD(P)H] [Mobilitalea sp.]
AHIMRIASLFEQKKTVLSFEVFPPKKTSPIETIYKTLEELKGLHPDFISVTYGAGGNAGDTITSDIAAVIKDNCGIEPLVHLTCLNDTREEIERVLDRLERIGIENILALRGDINPNVEPRNQFKYASELVAFIKARGGFHISGACYPEGHINSVSLNEDIINLKKKVEAGAEHLISQLFFDNNFFFSFLDRAREQGITVPIEAGIMPITNKAQIERMVTLCGASLPSKFTKMMQRFENSSEALRDAGIAYAVDQIVDLISQGVDGIHLYTMNNPYIARRISESISGLINAT